MHEPLKEPLFGTLVEPFVETLEYYSVDHSGSSRSSSRRGQGLAGHQNTVAGFYTTHSRRVKLLKVVQLKLLYTSFRVDCRLYMCSLLWHSRFHSSQAQSSDLSKQVHEARMHMKLSQHQHSSLLEAIGIRAHKACGFQVALHATIFN